MKKLFVILIVINLGLNNLKAQKETITSDSIFVIGEIEKAVIFHTNFSDSFQSFGVADQILYNHKGEVKDTIKSLKGIKLKDLLKSVKFNYEKPKHLNEFYFVLRAADGYKVVLSWNEVYNNEAGNHYYIITQMNGKSIKQMPQRILFLADNDFRSSRRYIKGLSVIEVKRVH